MDSKIWFLWFLITPCLIVTGQNHDSYEEPQANNQHAIWHIKAIHPEGYTMDIKALDAEGNRYDVKAMEDSNQKYIMDVKAFVGMEIW